MQGGCDLRLVSPVSSRCEESDMCRVGVTLGW